MFRTMSRWSCSSCLLLISIITASAQQQSFYVPNYFEKQWNNLQIQSNIQEETTVPSTTPSIVTTVVEGTDLSNDSQRSSITSSELEHFDYREPTPPDQSMNKTTNILSTIESSTPMITSTMIDEKLDEQTAMPVDAGRNMKASQSANDRQVMQSLVHLLPTNLWLQLQQNQTGNQRNQSDLNRQTLPDPVLLAEAAAQAGLPGPGPYPIPEHLWPYNPSHLKTKPSTTRTLFRTQSIRTTPKPLIPMKVETSNQNVHSLFSQIGFTCPVGAAGLRFPDRRLCNMYFTCTQSGLPEPSLCPEGYLFSELSRDCDIASRVHCGSRLSAFIDTEDVRTVSTTTTTTMSSSPSTTQSLTKINLINGTIECILGADGYYEDPRYCNVYHHCIAGIDYIEYCPNQLAWNDKKKMCDWTTNVNCTGKTMPVAQSKTSFCTNRPDGRYASETYCNVFHDCTGGMDHIVRCTGELQWDDRKKECGWESSVHCGPPRKMLPSDVKLNSTFCSGKSDGSYPSDEYCNVYHVCESGSDQIRQCPHQLYWDQDQQKCEWSNKVRCSGRTLVALSMESTLFCSQKSDGYYIDPIYCNVYHQCMADIDVKLRCPERLVFNETLQRCDWPETTTCKSEKILVDEEEKPGFCTDKPNGNYAHEQYCNRYYICQNGKDVVFTCQNNLRYSIEKNECDWAVNVDCHGKADYMWEGIKENFCKRLPDGNYPDLRYCNTFHQCQAAMDYPKRCPNRLMFNEMSKECDWEDKVDCKGREKYIDTEGLEEAMRPGMNVTRGRSTKFCMVRENGDYADLYYCNVYHNCHGGFDTIQYCTHGLVWRQESETSGRCDWSLERSSDGADCNGKAVFFIEKLGETDALANLRSEFCLSKGQGLYEHQQYCDLYVQCNEQGVAVTMECSPGLIFNEKKKECDYQTNGDESENLCLTPRKFLRSKPKSDQASILFGGVDATGQFPTHFDCTNKNPQSMLSDLDWCNIYHVCVGSRDNIFLCPPGTIFNETKQGCMDRFDGTNCNGTRSYYKPSIKRQRRDVISLRKIPLKPIR